ncbi:MAG: superoxide dismutase, partial [Deltaproteobacteria bacterium CG_4_10_14_0_2_um_filter_43_8]
MHTLPQLPYEFSALEPHVDAKTMEIHHGKHHNAYVTNLNAALEQAGGAVADMDIQALCLNLDKVPEAQRTAVRNNGGGHYNHSLFWQVMAPNAGGEPTGDLLDAIKKEFGS